ncbi:hypothetical protein, partial [Enterobacter hormaechei]|uniref:hypothetical protein n=1 Tax=Enterobacter hormaechei TaxID=158836 RepID=UPI0026571892
SDGNGSHASTLKSPSYTKSVSWQHYPDLRRKADWTQGDDPYLSSGEPDKVPEPDLISQDTVVDEFYKEQSKLPAYRAVNKA